MIIREFTKPVTARALNESLAARFGKKINIESFTLEQLEDSRNKIRTKLSQVETTESFDSVQNETYQKSKMMLDVINTAIEERNAVEGVTETKRLREGEEDKAELVMAAKDMVDRITGWMEDTAEMQTESMLELADAIRDEYGSESSESFTNTVKPALEGLYATLETTRTNLIQGVGQLTGESDSTDMMGADDMEPDMEPVDDLGVDSDNDDIDDDFGASDAATGGDEPLGRAKRESATPRGNRIKEGKVKDAMMGDSEKMTKAEFAKKYGKEAADEMYESAPRYSKKK